MKKIERTIAAILASACLTAVALTTQVTAGTVQKGAVSSASLPSGTLIYSENFDGLSAADTDKTLAALGWTKAEGLTTCTMKLSLSDGKLKVDNLDASSQDSYALMMSSDYLKNVCNADYTYQYDVTYIDAGNNSRYVSLLCNYDGKDNYNTVDMRIRGDGYNQTRNGSSWIHYNNTTCPLRATDDTAIINQLFKTKFDTNGFLLKGKTVTVRVETSIKNGPTVYVNGILASDMQANKDKWNTINSYAICFKASKLVKAEIDNIKIWTGTDDKPLEVKADTAASAGTSVTTSASTADMTSVSVIALVAGLGLASAVWTKRKKKN